MNTRQALNRQILDRARELGASLAGLVPLTALRQPTRHLPLKQGSLLVLAMEHPTSEPELDWWDGEGGTEGNRRLIALSEQLQRFLAQEWGIRSYPLPYHPWRGGVLLKDAAALAGLGSIGDNNLLVTPQYGPRVRLRALLFDREVPYEPGRAFAPCAACPHPCWKACPQQAFATGAFVKPACARQMKVDEANAALQAKAARTPECVPYCRACELACPVGR